MKQYQHAPVKISRPQAASMPEVNTQLPNQLRQLAETVERQQSRIRSLESQILELKQHLISKKSA